MFCDNIFRNQDKKGGNNKYGMNKLNKLNKLHIEYKLNIDFIWVKRKKRDSRE